CFVGHRLRSACQERSQSQKRPDSTFTLRGRAAPCRHHEDNRFAICTGYKAELHGEVVRRGGCNVSATLQHGPCLRKRVDKHPGTHARQVMQLEVHIGYDTEIAATTPQGPEQLLLIAVMGGHDAAVGEYDLDGE